jgi:hypothetical protein
MHLSRSQTEGALSRPHLARPDCLEEVARASLADVVDLPSTYSLLKKKTRGHWRDAQRNWLKLRAANLYEHSVW